MKQLVRYIVVAILGIMSCTHIDTSMSADVSILIDVTDTFLLRPDNFLFSLYDFNHNPDMAASYRIGIIADKFYTPKREGSLEDGVHSEVDNKTDDPNFRQKRIRAFYDTFCGNLTSVQHVTGQQSELQYSLCYQQIATELTRICKSQAKVKSLVVFSDLLEKSPILDCYSAQGQKVMKAGTDSIVSKLLHTSQFPSDLSGVSVFVFYCPQTREADYLFRKMAAAYQSLVESRGGAFSIETTYPPHWLRR